MSFSRKLHEKYSAYDGSEQIALLYSLETLEELLKTRTPTHILELGGGIGTISELILVKSNAILEVIENNQFCRERMVQNLSELRKYKLIDNYQYLSGGSLADMLVIDANNGIYNVSKLISLMPNIEVIFIEGHHLAHRINISLSLWRKGLIQKFYDERPKRGDKGCGIFIISKKTRREWLLPTLTFLNTYKNFAFSILMIRIRKKIGNLMNFLSCIPFISFIRKLYFKKIPWNY